MSVNTLFVAWQDKAETRLWFPVGRLDADLEEGSYCFRYTAGAKRAQDEAKFLPLFEFPDFYRAYRSPRLFALFQNRIINPSRPDRLEYLQGLDLSENANPLEILSVNGGERITDTYEVFPKLIEDMDGYFTCRFFLHGWRYVNKHSRKRIRRLQQGDRLHVALELNNPVDKIALQIQTWHDYFMIGWTPRYLVEDLARVVSGLHSECEASVVRIGRMLPPSNQHVLIEFRGRWENHRPMESVDFLPLVE